MSAEQTGSTPSAEQLPAPLNLMKGYADRGDAPGFMKLLYHLYETNRFAQDPNLLIRVREVGNNPVIWKDNFDVLKRLAAADDKRNMPSAIRDARVLGMDEEPEIAEVLDSWQQVYGIDEYQKPEPEQIPPEDYDSRPWQEVFSGAVLLSNAGLDADVYIKGKYPTNVIKVFRPGKHAQFQNEVALLKRLRGLPNVVEMIGFADRTTDPYIAKVFVEAAKPHPIFNPDFKEFPISKVVTDRISPDKIESYQTAAAWLVSALEAIVQIHQRGIMVRDFKFDDYLWDEEERKTVLIDFGNALDIDKRRPSEMVFTPQQDATSLIQVLLAKTFPGRAFAHMTLDPDGDANWALYGEGPSKTDALARIKGHVQSVPYRAVPSFIKIIEMMEGGSHSVQEYLDVTKAYFKEVGLLA